MGTRDTSRLQIPIIAYPGTSRNPRRLRLATTRINNASSQSTRMWHAIPNAYVLYVLIAIRNLNVVPNAHVLCTLNTNHNGRAPRDLPRTSGDPRVYTLGVLATPLARTRIHNNNAASNPDGLYILYHTKDR